MIVVRYVALTALVVWLGGALVLAFIVEPAILGGLQSADPTGGIALGRWLGEAGRQFHVVTYVCGACLILCLFLMKFVGPPPPGFIPRVAIVVVMLALSVYSGTRLAPEIAALGSARAAADDDAARRERLNRLSNAITAINAGLGFVMLFWYVRES